jgi:hypothetical protein
MSVRVRQAGIRDESAGHPREVVLEQLERGGLPRRSRRGLELVLKPDCRNDPLLHELAFPIGVAIAAALQSKLRASTMLRVTR